MLPSGFGRAEDGDAIDGLGHGVPHRWRLTDQNDRLLSLHLCQR